MARKLFQALATRGKDLLGCGRVARVLGASLHSPRLWHLNRNNVASAISVGLFIAFVPVPFQMLLAAAAALGVGCNLPISVATVWISNPITMPAMFYGAYCLGSWLLGTSADTPVFTAGEDYISALLSQLGAAWKPLLLGCLVAGLSAAALGHAAVRVLWRMQVASAWSRRRQARHQRRQV